MIEIIGTVGGKMLCSAEKDDLARLLGFDSEYDCKAAGKEGRLLVGYKIDIVEAWSYMKTIRGLRKAIEQERMNLMSIAERLVEPKFASKGGL